MEPMSIDLEILANYHVMGFDELFVVVFEGSSLEEFTVPETWVFSWGLIDLKSIVVQEVSDDKASICVLWFWFCEYCIESEGDLLINPLEEVLLWGFRDQSEDIPEGIFLWTYSIVRRDDDILIMW